MGSEQEGGGETRAAGGAALETGWAQEGCCQEPSAPAPPGLTEWPEPRPRGLQFPDFQPLVRAAFTGGDILRLRSLVMVAEIITHLQELRLGGHGPA